MPDTAAEILRDQLLSHQIGLARLANHERDKILRLWARTERDLRRELEWRLRRIQFLGYDPGPITTTRLTSMIDDLADLRRAGLADVYKTLADDLEDVAAYEAEYVRRAVSRAIPSELPYTWEVASPDLMRAIVRSRPFQGRLLRDHFRVLSRRNGPWARALKQRVEMGLVAGDAIQTIVRDVNARALGLTRANINAIVHTAISHVTGSMRDELGQQNDDVVKGYQWLSTLDLRTTVEYCVPRDGMEYDLNYEPIGHDLPWDSGPGRLHWNCRSTATYILKSWKEMGANYREVEGETRASMDGQVPATTTSEDFFRRSLNDPQRRLQLERLHGKSLIDKVAEGRVSLGELAKAATEKGSALNLDDIAKIEGISRGGTPIAAAYNRAATGGIGEQLADDLTGISTDNLEEIENMIRGDSREMMWGFDSEGRAVAVVPGTKHGVKFSKQITDTMRNGTLTHNHPSGVSFSLQDAKLLIADELSEIRAVGLVGDVSYTYSMKAELPRSVSRKLAYEDVKDAWHRLGSPIYDRYARKWQVAGGAVDDWPLVANIIQDETWQSISDELGWLVYLSRVDK